MNQDKNAIYLRTCRDLRDNLLELSDSKGRLLSERALCDRFSVSRITLRKSLDELRREGRIYSERQRNYICEFNGVREIGILVDCYKPSPHLPDPATMAGIMDEIAKAKCNARILLTKNAERIPDMVERYNLQGLLWINPPERSWGAITSMMEECGIKISCLLIDCDIKPDSQLKSDFVAIDREFQGAATADYFLDRNCRQVAYLGRADNTYESFRQRMESQGFKCQPNFRIDQPSRIVSQLPKLLKKKKVSGIVANGGMPVVSMFKAFSENPDLKNIELDILIPRTQQTEQLMLKNPDLKISQLTHYPDKVYGIEAMKMLARRIDGEPSQVPIFIKSQFITPKGSKKRANKIGGIL